MNGFKLFSRAARLAQNVDGDVKMESFEMGIVLDNGIYAIVPHIKIATVKKTSLVRLYRVKNTRVKKGICLYPKKK